MTKFPDDFTWGVATASYQIEGGVNEEGRGESIWDRFSHTPGKVENGDNGDTSCDHYHRYAEDVSLMKKLGIDSYRFSVAWSRIFPEGKGKVNQSGLDFYRRLVDLLQEAHIIPMITLYHWDLPQALQDEGGWDNPDCAKYFTNYAYTLFKEFSFSVPLWVTHNEPFITAMRGHAYGQHAPGYQDFSLALRVSHRLLYSHALAVQMFRENFAGSGEVGITLNVAPVYPLDDSPAAQVFDGFFNRWFLDPVFKGYYPQDMWDLYHREKVAPHVPDDELSLIGEMGADFLGVNYYSNIRVRKSDEPVLYAVRETPDSVPVTEMGWEVYPEGLYDFLMRLTKEYGMNLHITENGAAYPDHSLEDDDRIAYLSSHATTMLRALAEGVPLKSYYLWSFIDNFEWAFGYSRKFGIVHCDFSTLKRSPKKSFYWYQNLIRSGAVPKL